MNINRNNLVLIGSFFAGMIAMVAVSLLTLQFSSAQPSAAPLSQAKTVTVESVGLPAAAQNIIGPAAPSGALRDGPKPTRISDVPDVKQSLASFGAHGDGSTLDDTALLAALATGKTIDGRGLIYKVSTKPESFKNIQQAAFKVGNVIYPTRDFLRTDTAKITNGLMYTAWAQDKAYKVGDQLRVWVNEKQSHADGTNRIALYSSDDGGATWSLGEYLALKASGNTLWSAGFDGTSEYLFVRVPVISADNRRGNDLPPYKYQMWKRVLGSGGTQDYNAPWTKSEITFPTIAGWIANGTQPVMVHSFSVGHDDSIVVGASYEEGAAALRSTDGGYSWTAHILAEGNTFEEPTIRYVASLGIYCGFMRHGGSGNPRWWISTDNLATVVPWAAPSGYFGLRPLAHSTVSFDVDQAGNFHAVTAYRNGILEGTGSDDRATTFYITGPVIPGNIWTNPATKLYALGQISRREHGGASALGQGSVIATPNKIHLFYGMEGRTGVVGGYSTGNRVADIFQTVIFLDHNGSFFDERSDLAGNRSTFSHLRKVSGSDTWVIPNTDAPNRDPIILSGRPNYYRNPRSIALASDTLTLTGTRAGLYTIDTERGASNSNLSSIVDANAADGDMIILSTTSSKRDVTINHNVGNIICGSDKLLDSAADKITLMFMDGNWHMISFADNGT